MFGKDEILVGGQWRQGRGAYAETRDPATGEVIAGLRQAAVEDVDEAVEAGRRAAAEPGWPDLLPHERARYLVRIAELIAERAEDLARLQTADTGKSINETRALVASAAGTFRYFAGALETLEDAWTPPRGPYLTVSLHEPIGVVGAITPWNSPIASDAQKIAPVLAAGNAVVLKPAEWTPLVSLGLGGKSPTIVLPDADVDQAVAGVLFGIFSSSGQSCVAGSRVFVHADRYDEVLGRIVRAAEKLRVGPGGDPATQVAPLVTHAHRDRVAAMVDRARAEGARVLCCGRAPEGEEYAAGAYYLPTELDGLPNDAATCQEEIFGPMLVALPFTGEEDLVRQANDTVYGLAYGVWTRDYRAAWRVARRVEAGTVWVNTYKQFSVSTPFGGWKEGGIGTEKGRAGILGCTRNKSVYWGMDEEPLPWAGS
ncbi:aldehyde dehydrogenase family protein [Spirillospora sp. CA-255316]